VPGTHISIGIFRDGVQSKKTQDVGSTLKSVEQAEELMEKFEPVVHPTTPSTWRTHMIPHRPDFQYHPAERVQYPTLKQRDISEYQSKFGKVLNVT
jgi:hypothetical protein